uniref:(California timema) hypothetical protein n=1 Tax=Timema californicum TaxID=61474 RepID=A0A7R9JD67_TIMCA|nr:unnamed protein product [Timema californicum]
MLSSTADGRGDRGSNLGDPRIPGSDGLDILDLRTDNTASSSPLSTHHCQKEAIPVYYPSPNVRRFATQLSEEEQIKIAKRIGLIQHLPIGTYDGSKKNRE